MGADSTAHCTLFRTMRGTGPAHVVAPFLLVVAASASCADHYSCCCQYDFFIPVMCECIENEPRNHSLFDMFEKDNCARAERSKVSWWMRFEVPEWREHGVCTNRTPVVTREELADAEAKEKRFR